MPKSSEMPPEDYQLEENEERSMIEPKSYENPRLQELIKVLIEWINDELHEDRIIVQVNKQTFFREITMSNFHILSFNELFFSEFFVQVNKHFFLSREITMSNFFILSFNEFFLNLLCRILRRTCMTDKFCKN